jgi:hypothetical protein
MIKFLRNTGILFIFFAIFLTAQVFAQPDGYPENLCRPGYFSRESKDYKLARIIGNKTDKIHFYGDDPEDCPQGKNCRLKSYLIPGDEIIVSSSFGDYACSWFQPQKGRETVGWIRLENLEWIEINQNPAQKNWLGDWRYPNPNSSIVISKSKKPNLLALKGDSVWDGGGGNVHVGGFDNIAKPNGYKLDLNNDYDCEVSMQLLGKYLIVSDNLRCGGVNVTFTGIYQKRTK